MQAELCSRELQGDVNLQDAWQLSQGAGTAWASGVWGLGVAVALADAEQALLLLNRIDNSWFNRAAGAK
jgi:hypothetical protein